MADIQAHAVGVRTLRVRLLANKVISLYNRIARKGERWLSMAEGARLESE